MSFGYDVKHEIISQLPTDVDLRKMFAYGMFIMGKHFSKNAISLHTEHKEIADLYTDLIFESITMESDVSITEHKKNNGTIVYLVNVEDCNDRIKILNYFGYTGNELNRRILLKKIDSLQKASAFMSGAFLACGSISDPLKSYHVEFVVDHMKLSKDFEFFMSKALREPKIVQRRGSYIIYTKDSTLIEDLMTFMGAVQSSLQLMNVKVYKDLRNKVNRVTNCETANIDKIVAAASKQTDDINYIFSTMGEEFLNDELREVAELRIENPEMSLREMGTHLSKPLTRSGVNHRLKKISQIADELRKHKVKPDDEQLRGEV